MKKLITSTITNLLTLVFILSIYSLNGQNQHNTRKTCTCSKLKKTCDIKTPQKQSKQMRTANSLGYIQANTNPVLPSSYNFQEYVYAEPDDQGTCLGNQNSTAAIEEIYLSQTHRHAIGHPFLFTIGERPALLQLAVTGNGQAPDITVEGSMSGISLGTLCLNGPTELSSSIDLSLPNMDDYFSVTLPKSWVTIGLQLTITAGEQVQVLTQDDLKIRPYNELNLVNVDMDLMDYNHLPHRTPVFDNFLEELASAVPVSVVRFGHFPQTIQMPRVGANSWVTGIPNVVAFDEDLLDTDLDRGVINAMAHDLLGTIQQATGDFPNTIYFGNTLNLDPGGWGFDGNFVGYEYTDVFIHELGHAFSLQHWEDEYNLTDPQPDQHNYPYSGESGSGGGRGEAWNFIQDTYEFVSPYCQDSDGEIGIERSDCMQREHPCVETRPSGPGPWDGYGDFTAMAISDFLLGSEVTTGQVEYRGGVVDYQMKENPGYPQVSLDNGQRVFTRLPSQPQTTYTEDLIKLPGTEAVEQEVYLISGFTHVSEEEFNNIYDPIQYTGTLLPTLNPTDPITFATLQSLVYEDAPELYDIERDVTLKLTYTDGTIRHVLVPFDTSDRLNQDDPNELMQLRYFSVVVPGDQPLCNVELYRREFIISDADNEWPGNINDASQGITAENFMDDAVLMFTLDHSCNCPGTPGYIQPGTACDDGNPYTINDEEDGFCNCAGTVIPTCGQINNSAFSQSLAGWRYWGIEAESANDEAAITILNDGDAGFGYEPLEVTSGESYTIKFEAYAAESRPLTVIHRAEYDFDNNQEGTEFLNITYDLTTTKTEYEATFTVTETDQRSFLEFNFSGNEVALFIDNVCFETGCNSVEIPYNGLDDDCDPLTLDDDLDEDGFVLAEDCDDNNSLVNSAQVEIAYNGIDDDCDPLTLDNDLDQDGFALADDCDDNNALVNSAQAEIAYNGIDDDCNPLTLDNDLDQDGFELADDCDDSNATINPNATDIPDNGVDEDCDGSDATDIVDADGDGFDNTIDCDDNNADINPDQAEITYNGLDDDCDPMTLDDDLDQDGFVLADDCDDNNADINPAVAELTYNGIDDDCDPTTLDDDLDQDGFNLANDCDDDNADINPAVTELTYNGIDDDCDPATLDDDLDQDGFVLADDCDDDNSEINPDQLEEPYNGLDDDCNPSTLDDDLDQDGFALADDCDDENSDINPEAEDIPNNGIDEDCDGMDAVSGTYEIANTTISIFPNPTIDIINIDVSGILNYEVNLYNLVGKRIINTKNKSVIEVSSLPQGTYVLEFRDLHSNQKIVERIIVGF